MYGYKVKMRSIPKPAWAGEATDSDYMWEQWGHKNQMEICFSKFDTQTHVLCGKEYTLKNNALFCVFSGEGRKAFCEAGQAITHITVGVRSSDFEKTFCEITPDDCEDHSVLLLPAFLDDITLADQLDISKIAYKCIKQIPINSESRRLAFVSAYFELLHKIDQLTRKTIIDTRRQMDHYIKKVDYIIESNYHKKITLQSIAKELNFSQVYLSTLYKTYAGITFSEQLLNVRMRHAEKLLLDPNIPTSKVASLCGFCDENYFRKKFRQFYGVNVGEYRKYKNQLTLYREHPAIKPKTDQENPT